MLVLSWAAHFLFACTLFDNFVLADMFIAIFQIHIDYRDGSAVELIGLSASTVRWLAKLHDIGKYPYSGVKAVVNGRCNTGASSRSK